MPEAVQYSIVNDLRAPGAAAGVSVAGTPGDSWVVATPATLLAFDFGLRKLGVALGNTITGAATPLEIVRAPTRDGRFRCIAALVEAWQPVALIVGLALDENGAEQHASLQGRRFANQLHGRFGLPVVLVDERGSSMEAQRRLGTHGDDDAMAAAIILERYFDLLAPFSSAVPSLPSALDARTTS